MYVLVVISGFSVFKNRIYEFEREKWGNGGRIGERKSMGVDIIKTFVLYVWIKFLNN